MQSYDLLNAINRNCVCTFGALGLRESTCPSHAALVSDQRWLDTLLFYRQIAARLNHEEMHT